MTKEFHTRSIHSNNRASIFHPRLTTTSQIHGAEFHTLCALLLQLCIPPGHGPGRGRHWTKFNNADQIHQHEVKPLGGFGHNYHRSPLVGNGRSISYQPSMFAGQEEKWKISAQLSASIHEYPIPRCCWARFFVETGAVPASSSGSSFENA